MCCLNADPVVVCRSCLRSGEQPRGEARSDSDIDLFFDHEKGKVGLFELMDVMERAAEILGRRVDVMTRRSLHPRLRKSIEDAAVLVF